MTSLRFTCLVALFSLALISGTSAENCNQAVAGTLAAGSNPCAPLAQPAKKPVVGRSGLKESDTKVPGTYRYGDTTVHIGGSVSTDVNVRGR
jgi:hypothetical protein